MLFLSRFLVCPACLVRSDRWSLYIDVEMDMWGVGKTGKELVTVLEGIAICATRLRDSYSVHKQSSLAI